MMEDLLTNGPLIQNLMDELKTKFKVHDYMGAENKAELLASIPQTRLMATDGIACNVFCGSLQ